MISSILFYWGLCKWLFYFILFGDGKARWLGDCKYLCTINQRLYKRILYKIFKQNMGILLFVSFETRIIIKNTKTKTKTKTKEYTSFSNHSNGGLLLNTRFMGTWMKWPSRWLPITTYTICIQKEIVVNSYIISFFLFWANGFQLPTLVATF